MSAPTVDRGIGAAGPEFPPGSAATATVLGNVAERSPRGYHEKLVFGSDGPLVDARIELQKIKLLRLDPQAEQMVLGGNMRRLLGQHG